jgi:hypothetical protein
MAIYNISVPELNRVDHLAEAREQRDQRTRARMSRQGYTDAIRQRLTEAMDDPGHPLGELVEQLFEAPIRDAYDARAFIEMRDGRRVGAAIVCAICDASLASYEAADTDGF